MTAGVIAAVIALGQQEQQQRQRSERSGSRATAERQLSDSGETAVRHWRDNGATSEAISGATAQRQQERQQRSDSGVIAVL